VQSDQKLFTLHFAFCTLHCSALLTLHSKLNWPARVTLPVQRLKRPLHHFNACRPVSEFKVQSSRFKVQSLRLTHPAMSHACDLVGKRNGASSRCCPGIISLQKKSTGCCMEAKWSPHPESHRAGSPTEREHRWQSFGGGRSAELGMESAE
jgi:hypothetical protein